MPSETAKTAAFLFGRAISDAVAQDGSPLETLARRSGLAPTRVEAEVKALVEGRPAEGVADLFDRFATAGLVLTPTPLAGPLPEPAEIAAISGRCLGRLLDLARKNSFAATPLARRKIVVTVRRLERRRGTGLAEFLSLLAAAGVAAVPSAARDPSSAFDMPPWREVLPADGRAGAALRARLEEALGRRIGWRDSDLVRTLYGIGRRALSPAEAAAAHRMSVSGVMAADKRLAAKVGEPLWAVFVRILEFPGEHAGLSVAVPRPGSPSEGPAEPSPAPERTDATDDVLDFETETPIEIEEMPEPPARPFRMAEKLQNDATLRFLEALNFDADVAAADRTAPAAKAAMPVPPAGPDHGSPTDDGWLDVSAAAARLGCSERYFDMVTEEGWLLPDPRAWIRGELYRAPAVDKLRGRLLRGTFPVAARCEGEAALPVAARLAGASDPFLLRLLAEDTLRPVRRLAHGGIRSLLVDVEELRRLVRSGGALTGTRSMGRAARFLRVPTGIFYRLVRSGVLKVRGDKVHMSEVTGFDREFVSAGALQNETQDADRVTAVLKEHGVWMPFGEELPFYRRSDVARAVPRLAP